MTDFAALDRTISSIDPIDVARPELFAEDRWQEPFRRLRAEAPIQYVPQSKFGPYWSVTTYKPIVISNLCPRFLTLRRVDSVPIKNPSQCPFCREGVGNQMPLS